MNHEKVIIKQIPDSNPAAIGLEKYNRSRFPGCVDYVQVAPLPDGRYVTGLDPRGNDVVSIKDPELRLEKAQEKQELQDRLSKMLGVDLSPSSDFWSTFIIGLSTDQDKILVKDNPLDEVTYHALVSNAYVAPSLPESSRPEYLKANYYCHVEEVVADEKISNQKLRDQARAELYKISESKDRLLLVGSYLESTKYKKTMSVNTLYGMLSDYIDDKKNPQNVEAFLRAIKTPIEDIQYKVTVETAIRKKVIKFRDGQYFRGGVNLGRNIVEVLKNLKLPDYANEFISIHDEVNNR